MRHSVIGNDLLKLAWNCLRVVIGRIVLTVGFNGTAHLKDPVNIK